jgi:hypothetical protein
VFEEHPQGVGKVRGLLAAKRGRDASDDIIEGSVGVSSVEEVDKVLA